MRGNFSLFQLINNERILEFKKMKVTPNELVNCATPNELVDLGNVDPWQPMPQNLK